MRIIESWTGRISVGHNFLFLLHIFLSSGLHVMPCLHPSWSNVLRFFELWCYDPLFLLSKFWSSFNFIEAFHAWWLSLFHFTVSAYIPSVQGLSSHLSRIIFLRCYLLRLNSLGCYPDFFFNRTQSCRLMDYLIRTPNHLYYLHSLYLGSCAPALCFISQRGSLLAGTCFSFSQVLLYHSMAYWMLSMILTRADSLLLGVASASISGTAAVGTVLLTWGSQLVPRLEATVFIVFIDVFPGLCGWRHWRNWTSKVCQISINGSFEVWSLLEHDIHTGQSFNRVVSSISEVPKYNSWVADWAIWLSRFIFGVPQSLFRWWLWVSWSVLVIQSCYHVTMRNLCAIFLLLLMICSSSCGSSRSSSTLK